MILHLQYQNKYGDWDVKTIYTLEQASTAMEKFGRVECIGETWTWHVDTKLFGSVGGEITNKDREARESAA